MEKDTKTDKYKLKVTEKEIEPVISDLLISNVSSHHSVIVFGRARKNRVRTSASLLASESESGSSARPFSDKMTRC
jgi:hypothetical protein